MNNQVIFHISTSKYYHRYVSVDHYDCYFKDPAFEAGILHTHRLALLGLRGLFTNSITMASNPLWLVESESALTSQRLY